MRAYSSSSFWGVPHMVRCVGTRRSRLAARPSGGMTPLDARHRNLPLTEFPRVVSTTAPVTNARMSAWVSDNMRRAYTRWPTETRHVASPIRRAPRIFPWSATRARAAGRDVQPLSRK